ncbi:MAG: PepSY-associated TM helix domain-containing protein [Steroidobacteraceae bacterium]
MGESVGRWSRRSWPARLRWRKQGESMRRWHRWVMTVFVLTLSYWSVSGVIMALYDATDATQVWAIEGGGPGARLTDKAPAAQSVPAPATLASGIDTALRAAARLPIASVDYRMTGDIPRLQLAEANGSRDTELRFYAATGEPMTALVADGNPDAPQPANVILRNTVKMWHRGNVIGLPGQFIGLFTGLALIVLVVTGVWMYLQIWKARRRSGKGAFFWTARESLWRRLHRWISIVSAALILNLAVSGTVLAWGEIQLNFFLFYHIGVGPYPRPSPLPPVSASTLPAGIAAMLDITYGAAQQAVPGAAIKSIELVMRDGQPKGIVTLMPGPGAVAARTLAFQAQSGAPLPDWQNSGTQVGNGYFADWHQMLKRIHRGDIIGSFVGRYIELMAGGALVYLVISAWVLYFQMHGQRRRAGRPQLFWK